MRTIVLFLAAFFVFGSAHATSHTKDFSFSDECTSSNFGRSGATYSVSGSEIDVYVDFICGDQVHPDYLDFVVWLTDGPSPEGNGHRASEFELYFPDDLNRCLCDSHFTDDKDNVPFSRPGPGTYYVHYLLVPKDNPSIFYDSLTFNQTFTVQSESTGTSESFGDNYNDDDDLFGFGAMNPALLLPLLLGFRRRNRQTSGAA